MKKATVYIIILISLSLHTNAQKLLNGGIGYFQETGVYPGVVFEVEYKQFRSEGLSTISKANVGHYAHSRSHSAFFTDIQQGLRRSFSSGIVLESTVGIGVIFSYYNEEVYKLTESGEFEETSRMANPDLMPSITFGLGYDFSNDSERRRML